MSENTEPTPSSHATRDAVKYDLLATVIDLNSQHGADYTNTLMAVLRTLRDAPDAGLRDAIFEAMAASDANPDILGGAHAEG